jgi:peptidoglycan/LPS O-acetylase OafA/YrhL
MSSKQTAFRLDIQILRGIAVIYVILFHLNLDFFSSGFLGVDVFFVISGFLMTVVYKNSNAIDFYKKRAKRLLPAYFFTIFIAIFLAVFFINPIDLEEVLEEALYASFFLSNFGFLNIDTYYSSTEFRPLLHFWSLSVEIQYYLLFPLLFYVARKHAANTCLIIATSLFVCFYLVFINSSDASFFLMPTRIWEFFLGYVAATYFNSNNHPNISRPNIGLLGLIIILCIPLIMIDEQSSSIIFGHPGIWACVVCLATGLILAYGLPIYIEKSFAGKALIQAGKYSYSAYLAHFIVIIFYNYQPFSENNVINFDSYFGVFNNIILIVLLTIITYHCGEQWLQKKSFSTRKITGYIAILLLLGLISKPLQLQLLSKEERLLYNASLTYSSKRCSAWQQVKNFNKNICALNDINDQYKNILLVGDSHAGAIRQAFSSTAEQYEYNTFFTKKNSALTKGKLTVDELFAEIVTNNIDGVVFHYATDNLIKDNDFLLHKIIELGNILKERGVDVSIIMPTPKFVGKQPLKEIFYNIKNNAPLSSMSLDDYQQSNARVEILLNDFQNLIKKYDSAYLFCYKNCIMVDELQQPVYVDAGHLTKIGAQRLIPVFNKVFTEITNNLTKSL